MSETAVNLAERQSPSQPSKAQLWLDACCARMNAGKGVLLVKQGEKLNILGRWPEDVHVEENLLSVGIRTFKEQQIIQRLESEQLEDQSKNTVLIACSFRISGRPASMAMQMNLLQDVQDEDLIKQFRSKILRREEDVLTESFEDTSFFTSTSVTNLNNKINPTTRGAPQSITQKDLTDAVHKARLENKELLKEQGIVMQTLAKILDQQEFAQSLNSFVTSIAKNWKCSRVTLGLLKSKKIKIKAISGVANFDTRSALLTDFAEVLQETCIAESMIILPHKENDSVPPMKHMSLASQLKCSALCSIPLIDDKKVIGGILLECEREFTEQEISQLQRVAMLMSPIIALKNTQNMSTLEWLKRSLKRKLSFLLGSRKLGLKLTAICLAIFLCWSSLYTRMFNIDAHANIEANLQRAVVAYIPSFLNEVEKKAGDVVKQGDVLARLDVGDLELERIKWIGEKEKLSKEYRANLAKRDRSSIRILTAKRAQAQSQIDLLDAQIERATLRAPIDGVVIGSDLTQELGSPVERGQLLYEVASLNDYRLTLMVDESDIGWIKIGQAGKLRLRSLPDQSFTFSVKEITPVSESKEGGNRFRVNASLEDYPSSLRPGMAGFAKINIEERAIGWIWVRSFLNWLRIQVWKYS